MGKWRLKEVKYCALGKQEVELGCKPRAYDLGSFLEALTLLPQHTFVRPKIDSFFIL